MWALAYRNVRREGGLGVQDLRKCSLSVGPLERRPAKLQATDKRVMSDSLGVGSRACGSATADN